MQYSAQTGSSRREERIPFDTVVELRGIELRGGSNEQLEAEGFNVSMGGIALRAAFVPPLGAQLECRFHCPPDGELVCAQSEVTWVSGEDGYESTFGLRFVELDTKSATALRRYLTPSRPLEVTTDRLRAATLLIDGLDASVEAELKLADETRIVLEQQLTFLQLGRGVEVQVLGRGKERGRIASVELRHSDFDVPTLVFGVLLDDAPERAVQPDDSGAAPLFGEPVQTRDGESDGFEAAAYALVDESPVRAERTSEPLLTSSAVTPAQRNVRLRPASNDGPTSAEAGEEDDSPVTGLAVRIGRLNERMRTLVQTVLASWRQRVAPKLREQADALELPEARTSLLLRVARGRAVALRMLKRERRSTAPRVTRPPPLRVQRSTLPGVGPHEAVDVRPPTKRARAAAAVLTLLAIGLGAYALAPHSGADRARPSEAEQAAAAQAAEAAHEAELAAQAALAEAPPVVVEPAVVESEPFGDEEVPNGRVFVLRMNGPVQNIEGTARELGFKVKIPRRLSLDRASPIAQSHPAVARAMILNRGAYAELSVDFLPGEPPRYRVAGKGNTLEVTIERPQGQSDSE